MAETIEQLIRRIAQEEGVDPNLAVAVARQESSLNPKAYNGKGESSVGLFQLNQNGGMGSGYDRATLEQPEFNARIALKALARTQAANPRLDPGSLAAASQRPADPKGYARSVNAMLAGGKGMPHTGSPFAPQGAPTMADTTTLDRLRKRAEELQEQVNSLREKAKSGGEYERGKALEALPALEGQLTSALDKVGAEENRVRDDERASGGGGELRTGQDGRTYWVVGGKATPVEGMGDKSDDGQVINLGQAGGVLLVKRDGSVKTLVQGQGETPAALQTINDPQTGAVWTYNPTTGQKGTQLFEGKAPISTVSGNGRVTGFNTQTGESAYTVDTLTPAERLAADSKAESDALLSQFNAERPRLITDLLGRVQRGEVGLDDATAQIEQFDTVYSTQADRLAKSTEQRLNEDLAERTRHNRVLEDNSAATLEESMRSNRAGEDAALRGQDLDEARAGATEAAKAAEARIKRTVGPAYAPGFREVAAAYAGGRAADLSKIGPSTFTVAPGDMPDEVYARVHSAILDRLARVSPETALEKQRLQMAQRPKPEERPLPLPPPSLPPGRPPIDYSAAEAGLRARAAASASPFASGLMALATRRSDERDHVAV